MYTLFRSNRPEVSIGKDALKNAANLQENTHTEVTNALSIFLTSCSEVW